MRAAHMAREQIIEPYSKLDLSVHHHTDKQTEWWSKRAVILLHGSVDAHLPLSSPLFCWCLLLLHCDAHVGCRITHSSQTWLHNTTRSLLNYYVLPWFAFSFLPDIHEGTESVSLMLILRLFFSAVVYPPSFMICHNILRRDYKIPCGSMLQ